MRAAQRRRRDADVKQVHGRPKKREDSSHYGAAVALMMNAGVFKMLICRNEMHGSQPPPASWTGADASPCVSQRPARRVPQIAAAAAALAAALLGLLSGL